MPIQPHRTHGGILLQTAFSNNLVMGAVATPDPILWFAVTNREQNDNRVAIPPDLVGRRILRIADGLSCSETMRSHDELLS
jgi:hypothetical protein